MTPGVGAILISRPPLAHGGKALGHAHYSYGFAASCFERMFERNDLAFQILAHPEQFKSAAFAQVHGLAPGSQVHLMFRSSEHLRPIPGSYNVACFAWEFPVLKTDGAGDEPITDQQRHMLSLCDEIWTPCSFTAELLRASGLKNSHYIPAPIEIPAAEAVADRQSAAKTLAMLESLHLVCASSNAREVADRQAAAAARPLGAQPRLRHVLEHGGRIFLTVCNPGDHRKNLANLIDGFLIATQGRQDCVLLVKLATSGEHGTPAGYMYDRVRPLLGEPHALDEPTVIFVGGYIEDAKMRALYDLADTYLCSSIAEGQNLPLLEAMARDCLPVSTANTAMRDSISPDNAVVVREGRYLGLISGLAGDVAGKRYEIDFADRFQVAEAVEAALALGEAELETKSLASRRLLEARFSEDAVFFKVAQRLAVIDPAFAGRLDRPAGPTQAYGLTGIAGA